MRGEGERTLREPSPSKDSVPSGAAGAKSGGAPLRTWTDRSGRFQIQAVYVGRDGDKVLLKTADGAVRAVSFEKLSEADQRILAELGGTAPQ